MIVADLHGLQECLCLHSTEGLERIRANVFSPYMQCKGRSSILQDFLSVSLSCVYCNSIFCALSLHINYLSPESNELAV